MQRKLKDASMKQETDLQLLETLSLAAALVAEELSLLCCCAALTCSASSWLLHLHDRKISHSLLKNHSFSQCAKQGRGECAREGAKEYNREEICLCIRLCMPRSFFIVL